MHSKMGFPVAMSFGKCNSELIIVQFGQPMLSEPLTVDVSFSSMATEHETRFCARLTYFRTRTPP